MCTTVRTCLLCWDQIVDEARQVSADRIYDSGTCYQEERRGVRLEMLFTLTKGNISGLTRYRLLPTMLLAATLAWPVLRRRRRRLKGDVA